MKEKFIYFYLLEVVVITIFMQKIKRNLILEQKKFEFFHLKFKKVCAIKMLSDHSISLILSVFSIR